MKKKLVALFATAALAVSTLAGCGSTETATAAPAANQETAEATATEGEVEAVALKIWSPEDELEITQELCENFAKAHPEYEITWDFEIMENADSITELKKDPEVAADVFVYPTGGVPELIEAGLIYPISVDLDVVNSLYGESALKACSQDGILYGIPQTPNSFFMFYNTDIFTADEAKSVETMMSKDLGDDMYNFSFTISNSWYLESFFYGAGGTLYGADGMDATACSWNDETGYKVGQYLINLVNNEKYLEDVDGVAGAMFKDGKLGAVCTGTWSAEDFKDALGDKLAATVLPVYELEGKQCQLSNFADYKAYGVKSNTAYPKAAQQVAEWLANEDAQLTRFQKISMTPTVMALLENEEVQANVAACALANMTGKYSTPQPGISQISQYWDPVAAFGTGIVNKEITEANLQDALDKMVEGITTKLVE